MYGAPPRNAETSKTRATCSLWILAAARASCRKRRTPSFVLCQWRSHEFDRDALIELQMHGTDDDAHPADAQNAIQTVFAFDDVPETVGGRQRGSRVGRGVLGHRRKPTPLRGSKRGAKTSSRLPHSGA